MKKISERPLIRICKFVDLLETNLPIAFFHVLHDPFWKI